MLEYVKQVMGADAKISKALANRNEGKKRVCTAEFEYRHLGATVLQVWEFTFDGELGDPVVKRVFPWIPKVATVAPGVGSREKDLGYFKPPTSPSVHLEDDGETITLKHDFTFVDSAEKSWTADKGFKSDGASIPQVFWSAYGSPLTGKYRNAAIIHDYFCKNRRDKSSDVHRMFYEACLVGKLDKSRAKLAYFAVCVGGPYWGGENRRDHWGDWLKDLWLNSLCSYYAIQPSAVGVVEPSWISLFRKSQGRELSVEELKQFETWIVQEDPELGEIQQLAAGRYLLSQAANRNGGRCTPSAP